MKRIIGVIIMTLLASGSALSHHGMVTIASEFDVETTANRLVEALNSKGLKVFAQIDHAAGAKGADLELLPTQLVIFGNPKVGTPLMQCNRTAAIDLPQKALIWQDEQNSVWLTYNDPDYLSERHALGECAPVIEKIKNVLANFARAATSDN